MQAAARRACGALWGVLPAPDRQRPGAGGGRRAGDAAARLAQLRRAGRSRAARSGPGCSRVARNIVIDEWRTKRSQSEFPIAERARRSRPSRDRTDQLLLSWVVAEALTPLSPEHRAVLLECYYRGQSVAEASRRLGGPGGHREVPHPLRAARAAPGARGDGGGGMTLRSSPTSTPPTCSARWPPTERLGVRAPPARLRRLLAAVRELAGLPGPAGPGPAGRAGGRRVDREPVPETLLPALVAEAQRTSSAAGRDRPALVAAAAAVVVIADGTGASSHVLDDEDGPPAAAPTGHGVRPRRRRSGVPVGAGRVTGLGLA